MLNVLLQLLTLGANGWRNVKHAPDFYRMSTTLAGDLVTYGICRNVLVNFSARWASSHCPSDSKPVNVHAYGLHGPSVKVRGGAKNIAIGRAASMRLICNAM